jgi:uncharacterized membrane protein (UPF0127 family)
MIRNLSKKTIISKRPLVAVCFFERGFGMIGRHFDRFDAMVFNDCRAIHTMFMTMKIDVLFVDRENRVCEIRKSLDTWKPFVSCPQASSVIELPRGAIARSLTEKGDFIDLNANPTQEEQEKYLTGGIIAAPEAALPLKYGYRKK